MTDEGWTRWILENYGFEPKSLYNADIRSAGLKNRYDVIILPDQSTRQFMQGFTVGIVPGKYVGGVGEDGLSQLREFVRAGGTLVAFNRTASTLIPLMSLPVQNVLEGAKSDKFFCSGALLRVETEHPELPVNFGISESPVVMFRPARHSRLCRVSMARYLRVTPSRPIRWKAVCCCILKRLKARSPLLNLRTAMAASCFTDSSRSSAGNRTPRISISSTSFTASSIQRWR